MTKSQKKMNEAKARRHGRVRAKVSGTSKTPRLSVYRSLTHIYVQLIDDENGKTILSCDDTKVKAGKTKTEKAFEVGKEIAKLAAKEKITKVVFDRGASKYHGRVKAIADGARESGLTI
jgi:large subunit ribosomal protein L18